MKLISNFCRLAVGVLFIFSGVVKGIDPLGSEYKFIDYFTAFGMSWMNFSALFFSFALSLLEFLIGVGLLLNIKTRLAAWGALLFMLVFTPLTLVLALFNPVSDCGCFGDAWVLTNWETFIKNCVLLLLVLLVFFRRKTYKPRFTVHEQNILLLCSVVFLCFIQSHCYRHLPLLDFRPYAIGTHIGEAMSIPAGEPLDEYQVTLTYKNLKTGKLKDFNASNHPWQDTLNWVYASSSRKLVKEGYKPAITGFRIEHPEQGDLTSDILNSDTYTFLLVAYNLEKSEEDWKNIRQLASYATQNGYHFYGLTATGEEFIRKFKKSRKLSFDFCFSDETQLKTIVRSNPGLLLIKEGTIIGKWAYRDIPTVQELKDKEPIGYALRQQQNRSERNLIYVLVLSYLCIIFVFLFRKSKRQY